MTADLLTVFPKDQVLTPDDGQAYEDSIQRWADNAVKRAKFVVKAESAQDVSKALLFATENGLDVTTVCGGHSCSGASSSEDLVIDLRLLNTVTVDTEKQLIAVGGGSVWADVDREAAKFGLATVGGTVNHTGVGGLILGGGFGWLTGRYGLVIDNLVQAEVVTASGDILTCNESENADLFWAIRGAGPNFGVVTKFVLKAYPQPNKVWAGLLVFTPPQLEALTSAADVWSKTASEDEGMIIFLACPPPTFSPSVVALPFFNGSAEEGKKRFKAFYDVGPVADMTKEIPYSEMNSLQNPMATHGDRKRMKAGILATLDPVLIRDLFDRYCTLTTQFPEAKASAVLLELHDFKKVATVPKDATAFPNRGPYFNVNLVLRWKDPALDEEIRKWTIDTSSYIQTSQEKAVGADQPIITYVNYGMGDERARDAFAGNYERLSVIKGKYDSNNVFNKWVAITPATV